MVLFRHDLCGISGQIDDFNFLKIYEWASFKNTCCHTTANLNKHKAIAKVYVNVCNVNNYGKKSLPIKIWHTAVDVYFMINDRVYCFCPSLLHDHKQIALSLHLMGHLSNILNQIPNATSNTFLNNIKVYG